MISYALETHGLVKCYGQRKALDGFSLSVPRGAVMGLVGENGAGKTTWMLSVAGLLHLDAGEINILGRGPFDAGIHSGRISILPQDSLLPQNCSVSSMLYRFARMQGLDDSAARKSCAALLKAVGLENRGGSTVASLSHGMRMRCLIAQCFIGNPELVILDEPLNGLDSVQARRIRNFIKSRTGKQTIVISSHNLHDLEELCTHVAFVESGRVVKNAAMNSITRASSVINYVLSGAPSDLSDLEMLLPQAQLAWSDGSKTLTCTMENSVMDAAEINKILLPHLIDRYGVVAVTPGQSLEEAYFAAIG